LIHPRIFPLIPAVCQRAQQFVDLSRLHSAHYGFKSPQLSSSAGLALKKARKKKRFLKGPVERADDSPKGAVALGHVQQWLLR